MLVFVSPYYSIVVQAKVGIQDYVRQYSCTPLRLVGEPRCLLLVLVYSCCTDGSFRYSSYKM